VKVTPCNVNPDEKLATLFTGAIPSNSKVVRAVDAAVNAERFVKTTVSARAEIAVAKQRDVTAIRKSESLERVAIAIFLLLNQD
jgi:hypothetical protein